MSSSTRRIASVDRSAPLQDAEAFAQFYDQTHVTLFRYIYGLYGGPGEDVEDLTAEAFMRAWKARQRFSGDQRAAVTWLLRIARNLVTDAFRKQNLNRAASDLDPNHLATPERHPEAQLELAETHQMLLAALQSISPQHREIIVLRYILGWQVKQIAAYLGMAENTVSVTIRRILERLRKSWPGPETGEK